MSANSNSTGPAPAFTGPPGDIPLDTSNQEAAIITAWVIMTSLAAITVALRFYTRRLILRVLGAEDWLVLVAMVLAIGVCIGFIRQTFVGLGHHIWTVKPGQIVKWQMEQWYSFFFYTLSLGFTKLSILILYMRIMVHGPMRIANLVVLGLVIVCNIWVLIAQVITCIPLQAAWDPTVKGTCLGLAVTLGNSILHIITDFIIFALPIPVLYKLKINKKKKIGLMAVFSLGFFVCLISIIRVAIITQLDFSDITYQFSVLAYWGAVEVNLAIICACLTTLKPLIVRFFPKLLGSTHAATYGTEARSVRRPLPTAPTQRTTRTLKSTVVENDDERCFTRLDDESDKSAEGFSPTTLYEMESQSGRMSAYVTPPSKAHSNLGLR